MTKSSTDSSLVERLRAFRDEPMHHFEDHFNHADSLMDEAADRISTLGRELEDARALNEQNFGRTLVQANHDLRSQLDRVTSPQYLEEALSKLRVVDEAMGESLEWYGERARLARLIHSGGDPARFELSDDGGKRARAALEQP
jgi:hypothetical protein